jgi:hypothetical protein
LLLTILLGIRAWFAIRQRRAKAYRIEAHSIR